jgi:hypothetical protein
LKEPPILWSFSQSRRKCTGFNRGNFGLVAFGHGRSISCCRVTFGY